MSFKNTNIDSFKNISDELRVIPDTSKIVNDINSNISSNIKDPIGGALNKTITNINGLTSNINSKIDNLIEQINISFDGNSTVKVENNVIKITVDKELETKGNTVKSNLENRLNNIKSNISKLDLAVKTLGTISKTVTILKRAMDIQEALLNVNPVSKATLTVFKKAIKILFYKDVLGEYNNILRDALSANKATLEELKNKFRNIRIDINVRDKSVNNQSINISNIENEIKDQNFKGGIEKYSSTKDGKEYNLSIEKYNEKQLIARARNKNNIVVVQTSPSYIFTSEQLMEELKYIIENEI